MGRQFEFASFNRGTHIEILQEFKHLVEYEEDRDAKIKLAFMYDKLRMVFASHESHLANYQLKVSYLNERIEQQDELTRLLHIDTFKEE